MTDKVKVGDYVLQDYKGMFGPTLRVERLTKDDYIVPAHDYEYQSADFSTMKLSRVKKGHKKDCVWFLGSSSELIFRSIRVPSLSAQLFFRTKDVEIQMLQQKINAIVAEKKAYAKEHRFEWEIASRELLDLPVKESQLK